MKARTLANFERIFSSAARTILTNDQIISAYSKGRVKLMEKLKEEWQNSNKKTHIIPEIWERDMWGLTYKSPLMNAAGMFKNSECYSMVASQGAGAYLGGTGTYNPREGNTINGITLPFMTYPESGVATNNLGLPNDGDNVNVPRAGDIRKINKERENGIPIWWSVMASPDLKGEEKLLRLLNSMKMYEVQGVDVLEENESCPNTGELMIYSDLWKTMNYVSENFIKRSRRNLPVVLKLSNDIPVTDIPEIMDNLFLMGYSGVNFGNTSTNYTEMRKKIVNSRERSLFDYYTKHFEGGVSGKVLKEKSLELASRAVEYLMKGPPIQEFHVIRTGGIDSLEDIGESDRAGISMNQWNTGYWNNWKKHGDDVYEKFFQGD